MEEFIKYVGLDVHGKTIAVAVADSRSSELRFIGQIANTPAFKGAVVDISANLRRQPFNLIQVRSNELARFLKIVVCL